MEQVNEINALIEKSKPKALKRFVYRTEGIEPSNMCPICGTHLTYNVENFCTHCGQALDKDNYEL